MISRFKTQFYKAIFSKQFPVARCRISSYHIGVDSGKMESHAAKILFVLLIL